MPTYISPGSKSSRVTATWPDVIPSYTDEEEQVPMPSFYGFEMEPISKPWDKEEGKTHNHNDKEVR